jgi:hypothetical protein
MTMVTAVSNVPNNSVQYAEPEDSPRYLEFIKVVFVRMTVVMLEKLDSISDVIAS